MYLDAKGVLPGRVNREGCARRRALNHGLQCDIACALRCSYAKAGSARGLRLQADEKSSEDPGASGSEGHTGCFQQQRATHLNGIAAT